MKKSLTGYDFDSNFSNMTEQTLEKPSWSWFVVQKAWLDGADL